MFSPRKPTPSSFSPIPIPQIPKCSPPRAPSPGKRKTCPINTPRPQLAPKKARRLPRIRSFRPISTSSWTPTRLFLKQTGNPPALHHKHILSQSNPVSHEHALSARQIPRKGTAAKPHHSLPVLSLTDPEITIPPHLPQSEPFPTTPPTYMPKASPNLLFPPP